MARGGGALKLCSHPAPTGSRVWWRPTRTACPGSRLTAPPTGAHHLQGGPHSRGRGAAPWASVGAQYQGVCEEGLASGEEGRVRSGGRWRAGRPREGRGAGNRNAGCLDQGGRAWTSASRAPEPVS